MKKYWYSLMICISSILYAVDANEFVIKKKPISSTSALKEKIGESAAATCKLTPFTASLAAEFQQSLMELCELLLDGQLFAKKSKDEIVIMHECMQRMYERQIKINELIKQQQHDIEYLHTAEKRDTKKLG